MNNYDGVLQHPFLVEHWYKGFVAAMAAWLPVFFLAAWMIPDYISLCIDFASLVSAAILAAALTQYEGFELQPQAARYRTYTWVLGLRFKKWQQLPPVNYIAFRPYNRSYNLATAIVNNGDPMNLGLVANDFKWQVLLSIAGSPIGIVAAYAAEKKASLIAAILGELLGVKVIAQ